MQTTHDKGYRRCAIKYWLDTEFVDNGRTIDLISIAIVAEDGREYYAQSAEFLARGKPTPWLIEHVLPHLGSEWTERETIRDQIALFLDRADSSLSSMPELWGWCSSYDYVALCQLFGTMMDVPSQWPHYIRDIQYVLDERGIVDSDLPQPDGQAHNALVDARHIQAIWKTLFEKG